MTQIDYRITNNAALYHMKYDTFKYGFVQVVLEDGDYVIFYKTVNLPSDKNWIISLKPHTHHQVIPTTNFMVILREKNNNGWFDDRSFNDVDDQF